jgi:hypothetical protein
MVRSDEGQRYDSASIDVSIFDVIRDDPKTEVGNDKLGVLPTSGVD